MPFISKEGRKIKIKLFAVLLLLFFCSSFAVAVENFGVNTGCLVNTVSEKDAKTPIAIGADAEYYSCGDGFIDGPKDGAFAGDSYYSLNDSDAIKPQTPAGIPYDAKIGKDAVSDKSVPAGKYYYTIFGVLGSNKIVNRFFSRVWTLDKKFYAESIFFTAAQATDAKPRASDVDLTSFNAIYEPIKPAAISAFSVLDLKGTTLDPQKTYDYTSQTFKVSFSGGQTHMSRKYIAILKKTKGSGTFADKTVDIPNSEGRAFSILGPTPGVSSSFSGTITGLPELCDFELTIIPYNSHGSGPAYKAAFSTPEKPDPWPPLTILNLRAIKEKDTNPYSVKLTWTARGDQNKSQKTENISNYLLKMSNDPLVKFDKDDTYTPITGTKINPSNEQSLDILNQKITIGKLTAGDIGKECEITISNISQDGLYLFSVAGIDNIGTGVGDISNIASINLGKGGGGAIASDLDITTADLGKTVALTWKSSVAECNLQIATDLNFSNIIKTEKVAEDPNNRGQYSITTDGITDDKTPVKFFRVTPIAGNAAPSAVVGAVAIKLNQVNAISFPFHEVKGITDKAEPVSALKDAIDKQAENVQLKSRVTSIGIFEGGRHFGWVVGDKTIGTKPNIVGLGTPIQITLGNSDGASETVPFIMVGKR